MGALRAATIHSPIPLKECSAAGLIGVGQHDRFAMLLRQFRRVLDSLGCVHCRSACIAQALKEYRRNRWHKLVSLFETLAVEE